MAKRRLLERTSETLKHRRLFFIMGEGNSTEPSYFRELHNIVNRNAVCCYVECHHSTDGCHDPAHILREMRTKLNKAALELGDQAWIVVDRDYWTPNQLNKLYRWSQEKPHYGFALSNPRFEYWLLLHFEDGAITSKNNKEIEVRLKQYLPKFRKALNRFDFNMKNVQMVVKRAKSKDTPPSRKWPKKSYQTTVYKLVQNILDTMPK